jgi:predicted XRE-type DNA-binding protein
VRITSVTGNNRRRAFEVSTGEAVLSMPYAKVTPVPTPSDPLARVWVDDELGGEGFSYTLRSGAEGSVHVDTVLEYNEDPGYLRDLLVYRLSVEARRRLETSPLSTREVIRRLGTSPSQFYRLLDTANTRKSLDSLVALLSALDCEVDFTIRPTA